MPEDWPGTVARDSVEPQTAHDPNLRWYYQDAPFCFPVAAFLVFRVSHPYHRSSVKKQPPIEQTNTPSRSASSRSGANATTATAPRPRSRDLFSIDPRSLALFRIFISVLLLIDLATRAADLTAMYTDGGMFPRAEICRLATSIWNWSFHFGSGSSGYEAVLFCVAAVLALALLVGYETRLAAIGSWLMLVSIHHRVPPILSGAENLLRMLLFWAMFLPLGRVWSLDVWLNRRRGVTSPSPPILSLASAAILLQMALMYLFSAIPKINADWLQGHAMAGILQHDFFASPAAAFPLQFPRLLPVVTWGTLALECAAPFLLFSPIATARVRMIAIAALAIMHIAIAVFLEVGLFSFVSMAGLCLFLPAEFWNSNLLRRFSRPLDQGAYPRPKPSYLAQAACAVSFAYVIALNLNSFPSRPLAPLAPDRWRPLSRGLGLSQSWGMFGAIPSRDGWYLARAKLNDGSEVDLLRHGATLEWKKPNFPARVYPNYYWQKLFREMAFDDEQGFQLLRRPVAEYLCRDWNAHHSADKHIAEFEFIYCMADKSRAKTTGHIEREQLLHLDLGDRYASN